MAKLTPKERAELDEISELYRKASPLDQRAMLLAFRHLSEHPEETATPEELLARFRKIAEAERGQS
jgi:hypothetical protein